MFYRDLMFNVRKCLFICMYIVHCTASGKLTSKTPFKIRHRNNTTIFERLKWFEKIKWTTIKPCEKFNSDILLKYVNNDDLLKQGNSGIPLIIEMYSNHNQDAICPNNWIWRHTHCCRDYSLSIHSFHPGHKLEHWAVCL